MIMFLFNRRGWWGGGSGRGKGVLLEILGGGVSNGFSNPDPISARKNIIFHCRL